MITFISFYQTLSRNACEKINETYQDLCDQEYSPIENHEAVISAMFESARRHHPNGRFILITDTFTEVTLSSFIEVVRTSGSDEFFELERFNRMIQATNLLPIETHIIFLDPDIIIRSCLEHIFDQTSDLFFTYQKDGTKENILQPEQELVFPINIGFIGIRNENRSKALKIFRKIVSNGMQIKNKTYTYWFGLQVIFSSIFKKHLLKMEKERMEQPYEIEMDDVKFAFLDAEIYNFTPNRYMHIPIDTKIVHFKGLKKKKWMVKYWEKIKNEAC